MLSPSSERTQVSIWAGSLSKDLHKAQPLFDSGHNTGVGILVPNKVIKCLFVFKNYVKFVHSTHFPEFIGHAVFISLRATV